MGHIIWIGDPRRQRRSGRESYLMAHSSFFFDIASFPTRQIINGRIIWLWDYWFRNWGEYWYREQKLEQKRGRSESGRSWGKVDGPTGCKWTVQSPKSGRSWVKVDAPKGNPLSTDRPLSGVPNRDRSLSPGFKNGLFKALTRLNSEKFKKFYFQA